MAEGRDHRWDEAMEAADPLAAVQVDREPGDAGLHLGDDREAQGSRACPRRAHRQDCRRGSLPLRRTARGRPDVGHRHGVDHGAVVGRGGSGQRCCGGCLRRRAGHPRPDRLWRWRGSLGVTFLGISPTLVRARWPTAPNQGPTGTTSAGFIRSDRRANRGTPIRGGGCSMSGERNRIVNITGGTEVGAVIVGVNLHQGLKPTSLGGPSLGIAADVYDSSGTPVRGTVGELVIGGSWPAMTRGFWGEPERYLATYWARFPGRCGRTATGPRSMRTASGFSTGGPTTPSTSPESGRPRRDRVGGGGAPRGDMAAAIGIPDGSRVSRSLSTRCRRPSRARRQTDDRSRRRGDRDRWAMRSGPPASDGSPTCPAPGRRRSCGA